MEMYFRPATLSQNLAAKLNLALFLPFNNCYYASAECGPLCSAIPPRRVPMSTERKHREEIVRYGRMLHERCFVAAMDGNLSVRLRDNRILVTPTCLSKGAMRPADLVIVDTKGKRVSGRRNVTSEIGMHLLIYRLRPDVKAIVHAHPPTATGFAAAGIPLTEPLVCEVVMGLGCIPIARYGTPGPQNWRRLWNRTSPTTMPS